MRKYSNIAKVGLSIVIAGVIYCQAQESPVVKYNPMTNQFQTTYPSSELKYNAMENDWRYVSPPPSAPRNVIQITPLSGPTFNPFNGKWEYPE